MKHTLPNLSYRTILPVAAMAVALSACNPLSSNTAASPSPAASPLAVTSPTSAPDQGIGNPSMIEEAALTTTMTAAGTQYDKTVFYNNPAGGDEVRFMVTVNDEEVITAAEAEVKAVNQVSQGLQTKFKAELSQAVVGKKISELDVDRIGGASLTTGAFKKYLTEITAS